MSDPDPVAVYGAALATVNAVVGGFVGLRAWRERRNPLSITLAPGGTEDNATYNVRVVNRGSGPITIDSFGIGLAVDYRRVPVSILSNWHTPYLDLGSGPIRLDAFGHIDGSVGQQELATELHPDPVLRNPEDGADGWLAYWEGHPPMFVKFVWAADVSGRMHRRKVKRYDRRIGYRDWERPPAIVRGRLKAAWYRGCMAMGERSRPGSRVVAILHRLRLFPVAITPLWDD